MRAIEIIDCIMYMDLCGEDLYKVEVPSADEEYSPQTEEWWNNEVGGAPEEMIEAGTYLCYYPNDARDFMQTSQKDYIPDATIHINDGESVIYLYRVEDCA